MGAPPVGCHRSRPLTRQSFAAPPHVDLFFFNYVFEGQLLSSADLSQYRNPEGAWTSLVRYASLALPCRAGRLPQPIFFFGCFVLPPLRAQPSSRLRRQSNTPRGPCVVASLPYGSGELGCLRSVADLVLFSPCSGSPGYPPPHPDPQRSVLGEDHQCRGSLKGSVLWSRQ